jgi:hypothetical protein
MEGMKKIDIYIKLTIFMAYIVAFGQWLNESESTEFTTEPEVLSTTVTLKKGMKGEKIRAMQEIIKPIGRKGTPLITGNFWEYTDSALKSQFPEYSTEKGVDKALYDKILKQTPSQSFPNQNVIRVPKQEILVVNPKSDPSESAITKNYNFHPIPDGLGTNYRSAQLPLSDMERVIKKFGIRNIIRFNGEGKGMKDAKHHKNDSPVTISAEKGICEKLGCNFYKLSATRDQDKVNKILSSGNTLIHCAHGADRTGGNVGGYFYDTKVNPNLTTTEQIWKYTTQYNGWNSMAIRDPQGFYIDQAKKFGVKDVSHAQQLSKSIR